MFVQVALVVMVFDLYYSSRAPGESRGFAMMGIAMLIYASFFFVIPATLLAFARAAGELGRLQATSSRSLLVFHASAALAPFVLYPLMLFYPHPTTPLVDVSAPARSAPPPERSTPPPKRSMRPSDLRLEGAEWASVNGTVRPEDCTALGEPQAFVEGCQAHVRAQAGRFPPR